MSREENESESNWNSRKKSLYQGLNLASAAVDPLFSVFLFYAIREASEFLFEEIEIDYTYLELVLFIAAIALSSMSAACDLVVINPIEEASEMISTNDNPSEEHQAKKLSIFQNSSIKFLTYLNQTLANSTYIIGSASDAVAVSYLVSQPIARWGLGIPITLLGIVYYNMLTRTKVDEHAHVFIRRLLNCKESMLVNAAKSPLKSFEVSIQTFVNAINRGITFGYVMEQLLAQMFGLGESDEKSFYAVLYVGAATFYVSLFSRTLNVHKKFFNEQFEKMSNELIKNTKISKLGIGIDSIMVLLRAAPASVLIYRHAPENFIARLSITSGAAIMLTAHGVYVRYMNRLYQTALENQKNKEILSVHINSDDELSSEKMFDLIKDQFKSNSVKGIVTVFNTGARAARWFAFFGFLITLNQMLKKHINIEVDFYDLLCIHQLWCNPSLENDASFYQESLLDNIAYYRAKIYMEKKSPHLGWGAFWKNKSDYSKDYLQEFLSLKIEDKAERVEKEDDVSSKSMN